MNRKKLAAMIIDETYGRWFHSEPIINFEENNHGLTISVKINWFGKTRECSFYFSDSLLKNEKIYGLVVNDIKSMTKREYNWRRW